MWRITITLLALTLTGCAAQPATVSVCQPPAQGYAPAPAAALAFDPPVLAGTPRLDLSRDDRGPSAFAGFADSSTTFYSLSISDWYSDYNGNGFGNCLGDANREDYQRQAFSQTVGVIHQER